MRAVTYARYSSDQQREASIEDQVRLCRERINREGWTLGSTYTDAAMSGASRLRPGYQKLLEDARRGEFDVIVAEALDRLSRDQEDVAALYKQLAFSGVKLVTLAEGEITELHVGLKGTMNALFLKDLAAKTRRGLRGRVEQGRSGGGLCYGYDVVRELDAWNQPVAGGRRVDEVEAAIVRRIFAAFSAGQSPKAIALALNGEGVPGPDGKAWGPSTVYGNWRRGTGILNNELYIGRLVWNRQRYIKDPSSGKRIARPNPPSEWLTTEVPDLRIIDQDLWDTVKARQQETRRAVLDNGRMAPEKARRPAHLLSGLTRCGVCGGGFSSISATHYGCSTARNKGTCNNRLVIRRDVLEASVLEGLKRHLMATELVKEFIAEYHAELNRLMAGREGEAIRQRAELGQVERQIRSIIEAIKEGLRTASMKEELLALEARKEALQAVLAKAPEPLPRLHPNLAEIYRQRVAELHESLNPPEARAEAAELLRGLIEAIRLVPENGRLEIELSGDLAAILGLCEGRGVGIKNPRRGVRTGVHETLVAGVGFEPATFRL